MATFQQSGSWSGSSILAGYGLSATIGPLEPTSADMKRYNSRSGGISGKGNWMQTYNPRPVIKSGRPEKMYDYDFVKTPIVQQRLPGLATRHIIKFKGLRKNNKFGFTKRGPQGDKEGEQVEPVVGNQADMMDWFKSLPTEGRDYASMDTASIQSIRSSDIVRGDGSSVSTESPAPRRYLPPAILDEERVALNDLEMQIEKVS